MTRRSRNEQNAASDLQGIRARDANHGGGLILWPRDAAVDFVCRLVFPGGTSLSSLGSAGLIRATSCSLQDAFETLTLDDISEHGLGVVMPL